MTDTASLATELNARRPDRFAATAQAAASHKETHGCDAWLPTLAEARYLAAIAGAARATYVLTFTGGLGYLALHVSEVFGHTGRLDVLENDPSHAALIESAARDHSLTDRIKIHGGSLSQVVPSLNGPFDLVVLDSHLPEVAGLYGDITKLLRTGGTLAIASPAAVYAAADPTSDTRASALTREFLGRLADDDQFYPAFQAPPSPLIAVRRR